MIQRLYVHNFRCLENFELRIAESPAVLLIGNNGSGKSTVGEALRIIQRIARGENRIRDLVVAEDLTRGRREAPMVFEIGARVTGRFFKYRIAFDFPAGFRELRVAAEQLECDGDSLFVRELAQVSLPGDERGSRFGLDWHLAALPLIQNRGDTDRLALFREWLARMIILRPAPGGMDGTSTDETLRPQPDGTDLGDWFTGLIAQAPAAYRDIEEFLRDTMPDLQDIRNPSTGRDMRNMEVRFGRGENTLTVPFKSLSDGEKCFVVGAMAAAAQKSYGPLVCFWDEPEAHLAPSEVGAFTTRLRKAFASGGQFIATSHHPEAIRRFSHDNSLLLFRQSHLEPVQVRPVAELSIPGDLVAALVRGDVVP